MPSHFSKDFNVTRSYLSPENARSRSSEISILARSNNDDDDDDDKDGDDSPRLRVSVMYRLEGTDGNFGPRVCPVSPIRNTCTACNHNATPKMRPDAANMHYGCTLARRRARLHSQQAALARRYTPRLSAFQPLHRAVDLPYFFGRKI